MDQPQLHHFKQTLNNKSFKLIQSPTVLPLSTEKKCISVLWRLWHPPCFNLMFFFILANLFMEGCPTRMCRAIPGSDIHNLHTSEATMNDVMIQSVPCSLCPIRFLPTWVGHQCESWTHIMTDNDTYCR